MRSSAAASRTAGPSGLSVNGDRVDVERNTFVGCPLLVVGTGSEIERNDATNARGRRHRRPRHKGQGQPQLRGATTPAAASSCSSPGARVARNTANDNGEWGIKGVLGTIDGGRNHARGNAEPAQCLNVTCRP